MQPEDTAKDKRDSHSRFAEEPPAEMVREVDMEESTCPALCERVPGEVLSQLTHQVQHVIFD